MVGDGRYVCVLLAFVRREGREELGDGLYFWEVLVDFCVFEEVVEKDQQFSEVDALLIAVALSRALMGQFVHCLAQVELMVRDDLEHLARRHLVSTLWMRFRDLLLFQHYFFDQTRG